MRALPGLIMMSQWDYIDVHLLYLVKLFPVYTSADENIHRNKDCEALRNMSCYVFAVLDLNFPIM